MIQLTKGTNVLDINLSDFSGAGQDVVQNGSFTDIGSDLILNGDFAEIGSDLVTNGDFSAVPLSGELILDGDFPLPNVNWQVLPTATINGGSATIQGLGSLTSTGNNWGVAQDVTGHAVGKSYKVTFTAKQLTGVGVMYGGIGYVNQFSQVITSEYVTYTFYQTSTTSGTNWDEVAFGGILATGGEVTNTFEIKDVSVKEVINLVSNPIFTDGVEKIVDGDFPFPNTAWSLNAGVTVPSAGILDFDGTGGAYASQDILTSGKSYKVSIAVATTSLETLNVFLGGGNSIYSSVVDADTTIVIYGVSGGSNDLLYIGDWEGTITSVSVKELGEDWTELDPTNTFGEHGLTMTSTEGADVRIRTGGILADSTSYKVTYTIHDVDLTGTNAIQYYTGSALNAYDDLPEQGVGTHTFYYTTPSSTNNNWYFRLDLRSSTSTTDFVTISSILIQELGEDWTFINIDATNTISIESGGARVQSVDANISLRQTILDIGKSYKLTCDTAITTGKLGLDSSTAGTTTNLIEGANVVYFKAVSETFSIKRVDAITNVLIDNITVQEVGQDWTVTNSDSTQYVEFFGGVGGARIVVPDAATTPILTLTANGITLLAGKHYKLVVDVTVVTGSVKYDVTGTTILYDETEVKTAYFTPASNVGLSFYRASSNVDVTFNSVIIQQLDTNGRWVTFADPDSKSVLKLGQVDLEIDSSGNNCGVYQTGLIKPNKLYIITINMKATAVVNVEIAASLGTTVSAVIGTTALTTSYVEYSFEYVTPFAVDHDLQIHRLLGSGDSETISIDYVSMNGVDENQWVNDPTWNPFATSLVFVPTLTDESTNNSKQFTLDTSIADGGWDGRSLHGQVTINTSPTEDPANGIINLEQPDFLEGFYQVEIRGYLGTFYRILGKGMAHLERASTEDGYNRFEAYNDSVTYKAYEE